MSRVSVLIPSYNHAEYLPACVESILEQTFPDWSVIAIDDCSTDASVEILRGYRSERFRVEVNASNLGTYGTLARALEAAEGEYVAVLDSDDLWAPTKLERQVAALDAHPQATLCYTLGKTIGGAEQAPEELHAEWPVTEMQELLPYLLTENRILASSVMFRRSALRFRPELRYSGDWVALLDAALLGPAVCVPEPLAFWRMHDRNSFRRSPDQVAEEIAVRQSILAAAETWVVRGITEDVVARSLGTCAMHLSAQFVLQGRVREARLSARIATRKSPGRASLRRLLAVSLPASLAIRRLWGSAEPVEAKPGPDFAGWTAP